jgi:hypothetical protein
VKAATKDNLNKALSDPTDDTFKLLSKVDEKPGKTISYENASEGDGAFKVTDTDNQAAVIPADLKETPTNFDIEFPDVTFKSDDAEKKTKITMYVAEHEKAT